MSDNDFAINYRNDGKEKYQSHEIYHKELCGAFGVLLHGYGCDKEEAYEDFLSQLDEYILKLEGLRETISIGNTIEVDCFGNPIKR